MATLFATLLRSYVPGKLKALDAHVMNIHFGWDRCESIL